MTVGEASAVLPTQYTVNTNIITLQHPRARARTPTRAHTHTSPCLRQPLLTSDEEGLPESLMLESC